MAASASNPRRDRKPKKYPFRYAVTDSIAHESIFNLIHQESVIKVDCIVRKASPYRRVEFKRRRRVAVEDFPTWIRSKAIAALPYCRLPAELVAASSDVLTMKGPS